MQALGLCEVIPAYISLGVAMGSYVAESLRTVITAAVLAAPSFRRIRRVPFFISNKRGVGL